MASTSGKLSWREVLGARLASSLDAECYRALFETGEVTPAHAAVFLEAVAELARDAEDDALSATIKVALIAIVAPHETVHPKLLALLREECLKFGDTLLVLWRLGESALEMAVEWVERANLSVRGAKNAQTYFLRFIEKPLARKGLDTLYGDASWLELRVVLRELSGIEAAGAIPSLVRLAQAGNPNTQKEICDAVGRIGHPSGEPLLLALMRHADPGRTLAAAKALQLIGTRRALPSLNEALKTPGLLQSVVKAIGDTIAVIHRREEIAQVPGAVTIATGGGEVALSDGGEVALYREVEERVAAEHDDVWVPQENKDPWTQLVPAPRRVPFWVHIQIFADRISSQLSFQSFFAGNACVSLAVVALHGVVEKERGQFLLLLALMGSLAFLFLRAFVNEMRVAYREIGVLKYGELTLGKIIDYESTFSGAQTSYYYRVRYLDLQGETKLWEHTGPVSWGELNKTDWAPLLLWGPDRVRSPSQFNNSVKLKDDGSMAYRVGMHSLKMLKAVGIIAFCISPYVVLVLAAS